MDKKDIKKPMEKIIMPCCIKDNRDNINNKDIIGEQISIITEKYFEIYVTFMFSNIIIIALVDNILNMPIMKSIFMFIMIFGAIILALIYFLEIYALLEKSKSKRDQNELLKINNE
ncbi:MAG: hypothetical protein ACO2ON_01625 [Candidatus Nanopusillus sp.]